jgi:hypothetical protein
MIEIMTNGHNHTTPRTMTLTLPAGLWGLLALAAISFMLGWCSHSARVRVVAAQCQSAGDCPKGQTCSGGVCVQAAAGKALTAECEVLPAVEVILRAGGR